MADLSIYNLGQNRPSITEAFQKGRQDREQRLLGAQTAKINDQKILQNDQLIQENQQTLQSGETAQLQEQDTARINALVNSALILQGTPETRWTSVIDNRIQTLREAGMPTDDMEELKSVVETGDFEQAREMVDTTADLKNRISGRRVQSSTFTELKDADGKTVPAQAVTYNDGTSETVPLQAPEGFTIPEAETDQERRKAQFYDFMARQNFETDQAAARARNASLGANEGSTMANAKANIITASETMRKAKTLMALLDQFETGGFTQGLVNSIQTFFGVRPATEEEANNLMQQQALSMLQYFKGGNISEGERAFVIQMAPNFGLSTEGNKRILQNFIEDAQAQIEAGDAAMRGPDAFNTYLQTKVKESTQPKTTEQEVLAEFGEDKIAVLASQQGMNRQEVITQLRREMDEEKAQ